MKTNIYLQKRWWKFALMVLAIIIIAISVYYTNYLVKRFAAQESKQIEKNEHDRLADEAAISADKRRIKI